MADPDAAMLMGLRIPSSVADSVMICGTIQIVAFCTQNFLQDSMTATALESGVGLGLVYQISETVFCAVVPLVELIAGHSGRLALSDLKSPRIFGMYALMAVVLSLSTGMANVALEYVNIATLVMIKSAKLVPVMAVGRLIFKRNYSSRQIVVALMLVIGVMVCVSSDSKSAPRFSFFGVALVGIAMIGDALFPHMQEQQLNRRRAVLGSSAQQQMLLGTNAISAGYALAGMALSQSVGTAGSFLVSRPDVALAVAAHGFLQYVGLFFYLQLLRVHSPRVAVGFATIRKAATIFLGFVFEGRPVTMYYLLGATIVVSGMVVEKSGLFFARAAGEKNPPSQPMQETRLDVRST